MIWLHLEVLICENYCQRLRNPMLDAVNQQTSPASNPQPEWSEGSSELLGQPKNPPLWMRGTRVKDLPTPALLLDLDIMERNLARMSDFFRDKPVKLRPHFKAHQVISLANRQIQAGAKGITCARVEHAELLVEEGIANVLIANEIAGDGPIERFVELSHRAPVIIAVDNPSVVAAMAARAGDRAHELNVVIDLDVRLGRCGVPPGAPALALTKAVLAKGLRFRGLMGYEGHIHLPAGPEKQRVASQALQLLVDTKSLLEEEGIPVEIVTCGGTSDYAEAANFPGVTEVQAGSYLFMDMWYAPCAADFIPALTVLSTVISKSTRNTLVADAGIKAMSTGNGLPLVKGMRGLRVKTLHIEHILMDVQDPSVSLEVGDKIEVCVQALEPTLSLHRYIYGIRHGMVENVFSIAR
jgi:D-serine deaminase-like pyridoxal phosphate-dependent protein